MTEADIKRICCLVVDVLERELDRGPFEMATAVVIIEKVLASLVYVTAVGPHVDIDDVVRLVAKQMKHLLQKIQDDAQQPPHATTWGDGVHFDVIKLGDGGGGGRFAATSSQHRSSKKLN